MATRTECSMDVLGLIENEWTAAGTNPTGVDNNRTLRYWLQQLL
jgi:hypothetical protein